MSVEQNQHFKDEYIIRMKKNKENKSNNTKKKPTELKSFTNMKLQTCSSVSAPSPQQIL